MPSVGLAIIAKNEEKRLPNLLKSIEGAFDQIVLVDTGSKDRTVQVFRTWARRQQGLVATIDKIKWGKDFGAARRHAHSLLETEWEVWADCDDIIVGAQNLRQVAAQAPDGVAGFVAGYNYIQHPTTGACVCYLKRERLVRAGMAEWVNRVHEAQVLKGPVQELEPNVVEWIHQKQAKTMEEAQELDAKRNLDILEKWNEDEPGNTRTLAYLGTEWSGHGEYDKAIDYFEQYFRAGPDWPEEIAQVCRKLAVCHLVKGNLDAAEDTAFQAMRRFPQWTDSYLTLAEVALLRSEFDKAIEWSSEALRRGQPQTMLIINPLDYTFAPRKVLAVALASAGRMDEALKVGAEAWQLNPGDPGLAENMNEWRAAAKREHTANSFAMMCQQLIAHDEQLKALTLIEECVPHFVVDHPRIVQLRAYLRQRIEWIKNPRALLDHYENGGSKPEDFLPDDKLDEVASNLPRTIFLYQGIHEQLIESKRDGLMEQAMEQVPAMMEAALDASPS